MTAKAYYFGRGAGNCLAVQMCPGNYAKVFLGNGKSGEAGPQMIVDRAELRKISLFFHALWQERGHEIYTHVASDDPHDEVLEHDLDFSAFEKAP